MQICFSKRSLLSFLVLLIGLCSNGQIASESYLQKQWNAWWIEVPGVQPDGYGVYLFRKEIQLTEKPVSFIVHVSADNRYKLFVNG